MSCTDDSPCLAPMLRWVHSKTCQDRTRRPKPPPMTRDEALALVLQCARVCAMEGATRPDRWRLDDALKAYDRAAPASRTEETPCRECGGKREFSYSTSDGLKWAPCPHCRGDEYLASLDPDADREKRETPVVKRPLVMCPGRCATERPALSTCPECRVWVPGHDGKGADRG